MSNQPPAGPPPEWSQAGPPPPPAKKRKKWPFILGAIVVVIIIIAVATSGGSSDDDTSTTADSTTATSAAPAASGQAAPPAAATTTTKKDDDHTLVYEVTGDSGTAGNITYFAKGGNQSQETDATLPFRKEITSDDKSDFTIAGVTAQNGGDGAISCKVTIDGKVESENTSNGQYAVVSCNVSPF